MIRSSEAKKPDRELDVIFPQTPKYCELAYWEKKDVVMFSYSQRKGRGTNRDALSIFISDDNSYKPKDYIQMVLQNPNHERYCDVFAYVSKIAEQELLN